MRILVTGGSGFLGEAVCRRLAERGDDVRSLHRHRSAALADIGVGQHLGDVRDEEAVLAATGLCDAVVHCAAKAGVGGHHRDYERINVDGTRHVLRACARAGARLVHVSSPSVVHDGRDLEGVDESVPYPRTFLAPYPRTKAAAEGLVLGAAGPLVPATALRPHLIWGPGDPHFLPRLIARRRRMRLLGTTDKKVDTVYIDNAADACLLALDRLGPGSPLNGRAYFIAQDEPQGIGTWLNSLLAAAGQPPVTRRVPVRAAAAAGALVEAAYRLPGVRGEPPLTRFLVGQAATAHWFDLSAARRDLGYRPAVSTAAGLARLAAHLERRPLRAAP